ncbi:VOC family protein [Nocardia jejuensis]|uniref:VOC family protein n=1 Tax=Nocardia jejuensis TaxID=328049 RepID=UPI0008355356|nr:VOC family protein [Nocardia jejuensis]
MSVTTFFWFESKAEEAANRYAEIVPNSKVTGVTRMPDGSAFIVSLDLDGQSITLMNGGPEHPLTDAASIQLIVDSQEEVDRLWAALTEGGKPGPCGWLVDQFGLSWQVAPSQLMDFMSGGSPSQATAVTTALRSMSKIDLEVLQDAFDRA